MSRIPSVKTFEAAFPGKGNELRDLLRGRKKTTSYFSVIQLCTDSYNPPNYFDRLMCALNEILEGFGVEPIWGKDSEMEPIAEYINMGDTYNTTILYDYDKGTFQVTSWGDWFEANERRVKE